VRFVLRFPLAGRCDRVGGCRDGSLERALGDERPQRVRSAERLVERERIGTRAPEIVWRELRPGPGQLDHLADPIADTRIHAAVAIDLNAPMNRPMVMRFACAHLGRPRTETTP
jgi:hypothetical protein